MKMTGNIHTHSRWSDGKNTAEEMIVEAIRLGFDHIGFSSHSPAPFDEGCPGIINEEAYRAEINALKETYAGKITVLCGVEQDYYAPVDKEKYDYVIGSVHYLKHNGIYYSIDLLDDAEKMAAEIYNGDWYKLSADFFSLSCENVNKYKPLVVGHYDLIKKNNIISKRFDENSSRYRMPALECLDEMISVCEEYGGLFELNLGAVGKGYRPDPYPADYLLKHLCQRNARLIITTDSHNVESLAKCWEIGLEAVVKAGFKIIYTFSNGKISPLKVE